MDKYINMLFIKISQKYKATLITVMTYNPDYGKTFKEYKLKLKNRKDENDIVSISTKKKQELIMEMVKWAN